MQTRPNLRLIERAKPDLNAVLARAGYRRTIRDDLADFWFDVKMRPWFALIVASLGALAGMLAVIVPAIIVAWWVA